MDKREERRSFKSLEHFIADFAIVILCLTIIAFWLIPDKAVSESEKRSLAQAPAIGGEGLLSGEYMEDIESFFKDQFPLRDYVMKIKTDLMVAMGKISSQGVFLTKEGNLVESFKAPENDKTQSDIKAINDFAKRYPDIRNHVLIAPTAISVNKESLREITLTDNQDEYINQILSGLSDDIKKVDIRSALSENKASMELYYKTDHHWTSDGAYLAFKEYAAAAELKTNQVYKQGIVTNSFSGSLVSKSGLNPSQLDAIKIYIPETEPVITVNDAAENKMTATVYAPEALDSSDPYQIFLGGNHPKLVIKTDSESERKLLLFKDSYANCLIPFLLSEYDQITVIDPRYYYEDIDFEVQSADYTDVLFLFNANTLSQDKSLATVLNNVQ